MRVSGAAILGFLLWVTGIEAYYGIDYHAKASYFNYEVNGNSLYVFALNVAANGDVFFHMSGPIATASWVGVGFGDRMKDSFMIVAYPSADGLNTTISTRIASGQTEPVWTPDFEIIKVYNDTYAPNANTVTDQGTGTIIAHALCRNCTQWATGALDTRSTSQQMIFALGPKTPFGSDSLEASIPRHSLHGQFSVDMTEATNYTGWYGRVPAPNVPDFIFPPNDTSFASFGTSPSFNVKSLSDPMPGAHAALMCVAFVIIFPLGAIVMQFVKRALWHAAVQCVGLVAVFAGFGVAVRVAREYNKSKNYNSGHQVIGLIILAGLLVQLGLGFIHHSRYVRTNKPTSYGRVHFFLGPSIMVLGLINAGVGFDFAGNRRLNVPYGIVVAVIAIVFIGVIGCQMCYRSRRKYEPETDNYQYPQLQGEYSDYEMPRQPTYGEEPPLPYEPPTPYSPIGPFTLASPISPYTPDTAYTPVTPKTWRKEDITNWPRWPHAKDDYI